MRLFLDLFSGLGGASEAFMDSEKWHVMRIDNNELLKDVPNTIISDVMLTQAHLGVKRPDVIWASFPCTEFSTAYDAPGPRAIRDGIDFEPDLTLARFTMKLIQYYKPQFWIVENVIGSIEHLRPIFGNPRAIIGPFVLWGNFPALHLPVGWKHSKMEGDTWSSDPLRANKRAKIPYEISEALLSAIEEQKTLFDYI